MPSVNRIPAGSRHAVYVARSALSSPALLLATRGGDRRGDATAHQGAAAPSVESAPADPPARARGMAQFVPNQLQHPVPCCSCLAGAEVLS